MLGCSCVRVLTFIVRGIGRAPFFCFVGDGWFSINNCVRVFTCSCVNVYHEGAWESPLFLFYGGRLVFE